MPIAQKKITKLLQCHNLRNYVKIMVTRERSRGYVLGMHYSLNYALES